MISHFAVNWLAVLLATLASFAFGAAWYMILSKQWLAAIGKTRETMSKDVTPFIWSAALLAVMAYFIALLTPVLAGSINVTNGMMVGGHMWLGFVITSMIINHRYEGAPWSRTLIDGGYLFFVLMIDGIVIGLLG